VRDIEKEPNPQFGYDIRNEVCIRYNVIRVGPEVIVVLHQNLGLGVYRQDPLYVFLPPVQERGSVEGVAYPDESIVYNPILFISRV
jgi:hypothetical protein